MRRPLSGRLAVPAGVAAAAIALVGFAPPWLSARYTDLAYGHPADAARDAVIPLAEDAAGAAGTWLGKNGPEIVRDKIVPRFITSFNEAKGD